MNALIAFGLSAFAVWRMSILIAQEEGPFSIMEWIRNRPIFLNANWVGRGIRCPWCISVWLTLAATPIVLYLESSEPDWRWFPLVWWGMAGVVAWLLERHLNYRTRS